MLNRPTTHLLSPVEPDGTRWDRQPRRRLTLLMVALVTPLALVSIRVTNIMLRPDETLGVRRSPVRITTEPLPTSGGRILAADGTVLAEDQQRFTIRVHYRWIETPADDVWVRAQVLSQLAPGNRRDRAMVAAARNEVLARRDRVRTRLARLCGLSDRQFAQQCRIVQKRVERVVASVTRRREQTATDAQSPPPHEQPSSVLGALRVALMTPPRRQHTEPIVVTEELAYHALIEDVSFDVATAISEHPRQFPGIQITQRSHRVYRGRDLAAHVIGTRRSPPIHSPLATSHFPLGTSGVEKTYEQVLMGQTGTTRIVTDRYGEVISQRVVRPPRRGRDIQLTLIPGLQRQAEQLLDNVTQSGSNGGAIVVMDLHNGAIRAAASAPRFDLNQAVSPDADAWSRLVDDPRRPLFSRITGMALPPGSVFKTLSATAMLETGLVSGGRQVECRGFLDHPSRHRCFVYRRFGLGHGPTNVEDALCRSCNVFFFDAARRLARSSHEGHTNLHRWAARFGFGRPTGIDLPGEVSGRLPDPPSHPQVAETMQLAIGQGPITATPLQVVRMMAAIANGGVLVTPHVVSELGPDAEALTHRARPAITRIAGLSPSTLQQVRQGLERVVSDPRGTGYKRIRLPDVPIAGKTGTAEVGGDLEDHAWFAGYVPANRPRLALVVVLEHAGSGGRQAGPVARQLVRSIKSQGLIDSTSPPTTATTASTDR